ncbi:MAG: hypothetical protein R2838_04425 [Caldilineaceae bacterium]
MARYEWRTVFLYGALFLVTVTTTLHRSEDPARDRRLLVTAWLGGATVMAGLGVWQFAAGTMTITAEGAAGARAVRVAQQPRALPGAHAGRDVGPGPLPAPG